MDKELKANKKKRFSKRLGKGIGILLALTVIVLIANGVSTASFQDLCKQLNKIEIEYTTLENQPSIFSEFHNSLEMKDNELPNNPLHLSEELQDSYNEKKRKNNEKTTEKHKGDTTMNSSSTNATGKDNGMDKDTASIGSSSTPGIPERNDTELPPLDEPIPGYNDVELPHPGTPPGYNDDEMDYPGSPNPGHIDVELDHPGSPNPGHIDVELDHPGSSTPGHIDVELDHPGSPEDY